MICTALAKRQTAVGNEWLGMGLAMGHSAHVSHLVNRLRKSAKDLKTLRRYVNLLWRNKDPKLETRNRVRCRS